jgi:hypothetical protein
LDVEKEMHKESWVIYGWMVFIEREDSSVAIADGGRKRKIKKNRGERCEVREGQGGSPT